MNKITLTERTIQMQIPQIKPVVSTGSLRTDAAALDRLATHKAILEAHGIKDLAALGKLSFSATVVPHPGLVRPEFLTPTDRGVPTAARPFQPVPLRIAPLGPNLPGATPRNSRNFTTAAIDVRSAARFVAPAAQGNVPTAILFSGTAMQLIGEPLVGSQDVNFLEAAPAAAASSVSIPINTAYWAADTIVLADNTTVVIKKNVRYLVIIANKIIVGSNVALIYDEIPVANPPAVPAKRPAPTSTPRTSDNGTGSGGYPGSDGTQPMQIGTPPNAPEVEVWTLDINSLPTVNLKGQRGYTGVNGGGGGDGGRGGNGAESIPDTWNCEQGPGNGGQGGKGGRGGTGGAGGNGGIGGRWSLYTTSAMFSALGGFFVDVSGGEGGVGGQPGAPGNGGAGGNRGGIHGFCANSDWSDRNDGLPGPSGDSPGSVGPNGAAGTAAGSDAEKFIVIEANDFLNKLTDPAITNVNPSMAHVGTKITIFGFRFTPTDLITVAGVATPLTFLADTAIQCAVPNVAGGLSNVRVSRSDGSKASNRATLWIKPTILSTIPASPANRLRPGAKVRIKGKGFNSHTTVRVNGTDIAQATFIDTQTIDFVMKRPDSVPFDPAHAGGEPAFLSVAVSGPILASNAKPIVIATYQMLVMGDSIVWGEGLQEQEKFHTLVGAHVTASNGGISVYKTVTARCGAILGWNDTGSGPALPANVPSSYATIKQQAQALASSPNAATVDLILLTATANDVGFNTFLDPNATEAQILTRVNQYCRDEMTDFLRWLAVAFPAAKILIPGYYTGISMDSDPAYLVDFVGVMYGLENNAGLLPTALAVLKGVSMAGQLIIAHNSTYFATQANLAISTAVVNAGSAQIKFIDPHFGPQNAALASDAWVFGLSESLNILQPTDSPAAANLRKSECENAYPDDLTSRIFCELASAGHPNVTGAQKYAEAIIPFL